MPKSKLQKKRDNPRSGYWKKRADKLWGEYQHLPGVCAMQGFNGHRCSGNLEAHHLLSRGIVSLRHKPVNGVLLCSFGHKWCNRMSPHMAPVGFMSWLNVAYPVKAVWAKMNQWATGKPDYQAACKELESEIQLWKDNHEPAPSVTP